MINLMFNMFSSFFFIMFILVLVIIIMTIVKNIREWNRNNNSPVLTVDATVVTKRINVSNNIHHDANNTEHLPHHIM